MKSILISIKPRFVAKILNKEKTIEVRKSMPKCDLPIDVYIYCTKDKDLCYKCINGGYDCDNWKVLENRDSDTNILNGKVVAKFTLNKVEEYKCSVEIPPRETIRKPKVEIKNRVNERGFGEYYWIEEARKILEEKILKNSCLTEIELAKYLEKETNIFSGFYAWHISNLEIFDKPKDLSEFRKYEYIGANILSSFIKNNRYKQQLTKAPQSWQFIEV